MIDPILNRIVLNGCVGGDLFPSPVCLPQTVCRPQTMASNVEAPRAFLSNQNSSPALGQALVVCVWMLLVGGWHAVHTADVGAQMNPRTQNATRTLLNEPGGAAVVVTATAPLLISLSHFK